MTRALGVVEGGRSETPNEAAARRLRGKFAEQRVSASAVARAVGMTQAAMSRRMLGKTEFTLNELADICRASGVSFEYIVIGRETNHPRPGGPDGGGEDVRLKGFEPLTFWSVLSVPATRGNVIPMRHGPRRRRELVPIGATA